MEERRGEGDEHGVLEPGGGQALDSQQHSLHKHRYSIPQEGRSEIREEEFVPKRKESRNGGGGEEKLRKRRRKVNEGK